MPIFEYKCPRCHKTQEEIVLSPANPPIVLHEHNSKIYALDRVLFSVPAKRNPRHGEG